MEIDAASFRSAMNSLPSSVPSPAFSPIIHSLGLSTEMSAFDALARMDLEASDDFAQPLSSDVLAPTVVLANDIDSLDAHLVTVWAHLDELIRAYEVDRLTIGLRATILGDALHGVASVALDKLLSLRDEWALSLLIALQWVSQTPVVQYIFSE
jgi:hypothetical protein